MRRRVLVGGKMAMSSCIQATPVLFIEGSIYMYVYIVVWRSYDA